MLPRNTGALYVTSQAIVREVPCRFGVLAIPAGRRRVTERISRREYRVLAAVAKMW
jgi:hypothetical protein